MSDADALLAAVAANPADDLPRLIFADWLDENGDAGRAAFLRSQILGGPPAPEPPHGLPAWASAPRWERGFVAGVAAAPRHFLAHADTLRAVAPLLAAVELRAELPAPRTPFGGRFPWVRSLTLSGPGFAAASRLALLAAFPALEALAVAGPGVADAELLSLVRLLPTWPSSRTLRSLDLSGNRLTDAGANALAAAPGLPRLDRLDVRGNRLSAEGVRLLAGRFCAGDERAPLRAA